MIKSHIVFLALAASTLTSPLSAETVVRKVSYADLDLSRPKDVSILKRRVAAAIEAVCGSYAGASPEDADRIATCRKAVKTSVEPQLASALEKRWAKAGTRAIGVAAR